LYKREKLGKVREFFSIGLSSFTPTKSHRSAGADEDPNLQFEKFVLNKRNVFYKTISIYHLAKD
jgi:hypothetical protein